MLKIEVVTAKTIYHPDVTDLEFSNLYIGKHHNPDTRECLQRLPRLQGFCGPMFNGIDNEGHLNIRYESKEVYNSIA